MTNRSLITSKLPLTIQCMIENALLHSTLDTIKQPWGVPQYDNKFDPSCGLLEIRKWGSLQKDKVDITDEWVA